MEFDSWLVTALSVKSANQMRINPFCTKQESTNPVGAYAKLVVQKNYTSKTQISEAMQQMTWAKLFFKVWSFYENLHEGCPSLMAAEHWGLSNGRFFSQASN